MGYTLKIGELENRSYFNGLYSSIDHNVIKENHPEAPAFGEPTDGSNERWPSYTAWRRSVEFIGLVDLFYSKEHGLIREHPGCFPISREHQRIIHEAYDAFYKKYPNAKAGYSPKVDYIFDEDPDWPEENSFATRLEWLKYWVDWALDNCKTPVFYNY